MSTYLNQDTIDRKSGAADLALRRIPDLVDKIRTRRKPIDLKSCYHSLANDHLAIGYLDFFIKNDIATFKSQLYIAGRLKAAALNIDDFQRFNTGTELFHALLSDSSEIIEEMARFDGKYFRSSRDNPLNPEFKVHMWQLAIRGDFFDLEQKIKHASKNGRKEDRTLTAAGTDFFSLLMQRDAEGLAELITAHADVKGNDALMDDYLSYLATFETKLCWYHGIEVFIDNKFVPMELMPVSPLDQYGQPYDFLEPGWQPEVTGWRGKLARWLGQG